MSGDASNVDVLPRSSENIRKQSLPLKRKARHELHWSGKEVANDCKNFVSEIVNVLAVAEVRLNVRDAISAMVMIMPAMDTEMSGDASLASPPSITTPTSTSCLAVLRKSANRACLSSGRRATSFPVSHSHNPQ
jgi:hypothetical protein